MDGSPVKPSILKPVGIVLAIFGLVVGTAVIWRRFAVDSGPPVMFADGSTSR